MITCAGMVLPCCERTSGMSKCYILTKHCNEFDVVDDNLEIQNLEIFEIVGVYSSQEYADYVRSQFEADPQYSAYTFLVSDWEVE